MKITLLSLFTAVFVSGFAQTWNYIGSSAGIGNATEVDLEVSPNGTLFAAYIDSDNSGKVTVKKWSNASQIWQLVGTAGIGDAGVSGLQLQVLSNDYPVFAAKTMYAGQEFVELYKFNGTGWTYMPIGPGGYNRVDHEYEFSLATYSLSSYFTFYNSYEQETGYSDLGLITVSLDNFSEVSPASPNLENTNYGYNTSLLADNGNFYVLHDEADMGSWIQLDVSIGGGAYNTNLLDDSYAADELKIQKGLYSSYYHSVWSLESGTSSLYYRCFNGTALGTAALVSSASVADFDFDVTMDQASVFYNAGGTCYFKHISGSMSPTVITTVGTGTSLAPGTATSLCAENNNTINVIAYVNSGKAYVKEFDSPANIEDYDLLAMCEGTSFNNGNDPAVYLLDDNYSYANLSITASSQNTAVIPNSAIAVLDGGTLTYRLSISNTNDVSAQTTVDLLITLVEGGIPGETLNLPITVNANPTISFDFPSTDFCENDNPVSLANKATPSGGTWTGTGVVNNTFDPSLLSNNSSTTTTLTYSKTSSYGCTASQPVTLTINSAPALNVTTIPADCSEDNGAASVSITEGASPYTIYWSNGSTTQLVNNIPAGQYFLVVTDDNGCRSTQAINITTNGITQSAQTTNVLCYGNSTGAIDLTVSGANGPFTYAWSNGATTQDLTGLPAGQYDVSISDASGCTSAGSYTVTQASQLLSSFTSTSSSCGSSDGEIDVTLTGGTAPLQLQWSDENGTLSGETTSTLSGFPAGAYDLQIIDANACGNTMHFSISDLEGPVVAIDTIIDASCASDGEIQINDVGGNTSDFLWSNGATTANISNLPAGVYVLEATSGSGCVSFLNAQVPATPPVSVSICLVSVDTSTNTNLVVWEKPVTNGIDHFNIYRETSIAGQYQLIASQDYSIESNYTDPVASPSVRSWRYKISSVDQCGTESELSDYHKTIHLTINQGLQGQYNLSWDQYEGFPYSQFDIWRHTLANDWENIQSMPTNLFTYTDTPPSTDELYYLVTIDYPGTCTSTKANDFNSSRSNKDARYSALTTTGLSEYIMGTTQVYPNPSTGEFEVSNNTQMALSARVLDATGRIITEFEVPDGLSHHALNNLESGVYQVVLYAGDSRAIHKLSIRH